MSRVHWHARDAGGSLKCGFASWRVSDDWGEVTCKVCLMLGLKRPATWLKALDAAGAAYQRDEDADIYEALRKTTPSG